MKRKKRIFISVILILCLMTGCANINSTGEGKEAEDGQGGISLPCEDDFIVDVKADKGKIMLSTINVAEDFSTSTAAIWESADEGAHWKKVFEEQFASDEAGEIYINAEVHFIGQGGILQVHRWPKDNAKAEYSKLYYANDLENGSMEEVKSDHDMKNLGSTYFLSEDDLYGWDIMSSELLCLDLQKGTVQKTKFDDVDMLLDVVFDGPSAYIIYLSKEYAYTGMKYNVLEQRIEDAPVFEAMVKEVGKNVYSMITGVRFYPCMKEDKEIYRYVCSDGVFEFDDSGSKKISASVPWGQNEELDFERAAVISDEALLVYYTGLNGNKTHMLQRKAKLRFALRKEIRQLQRRTGVTTIYVTHDQGEAMALADRVIVMDHGRIRQIGTPREIYNSPADPFVAAFFGSLPMNLWEEDSMICGIRPEDISLSKSFVHGWEKAILLTGYFNGVQWIGEVQCEAGRFTVCADCEMEQQQTVYMRFAEDKIHRWQKG